MFVVRLRRKTNPNKEEKRWITEDLATRCSVRIDRGEEILEQVKTVALKENIQLASVQALGALGSFTVGVYKVDEKKYYANSFEGSFEIVSLTGTIDTMNGEFTPICI